MRSSRLGFPVTIWWWLNICPLTSNTLPAVVGCLAAGTLSSQFPKQVFCKGRALETRVSVWEMGQKVGSQANCFRSVLAKAVASERQSYSHRGLEWNFHALGQGSYNSNLRPCKTLLCLPDPSLISSQVCGLRNRGALVARGQSFQKTNCRLLGVQVSAEDDVQEG